MKSRIPADDNSRLARLGRQIEERIERATERRDRLPKGKIKWQYDGQITAYENVLDLILDSLR